MDLPGTLDTVAKRSGLYKVTLLDPPKPRNLRWIPLLVLLLLVAGYTLTAVADGEPSRRLMLALAGALLFYPAYGTAFFLRFFGPRIVAVGGTSLDERELMLAARAGHFSGVVLAALASGACFYLALANLFGGWVPSAPLHWVMLGLAIQASYMILPVLFASWLQPPPVEED